MDMSIGDYNKLLETYKTSRDTAAKVNQIFSQGDSSFSDPEYEAIVAGFMQNQAIEGLFERIDVNQLGLKILPADQKSLAVALLTKRGYDIVATGKDLAGEVMDIIARNPGSNDVVVMKCGPAKVKKMLGYLERPNTMMWILDPQNRLFMFRRGQNWDSFSSYHKDVLEGNVVQESDPEPEPEIKPVQTFETETPADVIAKAEMDDAEKSSPEEVEKTEASNEDNEDHDDGEETSSDYSPGEDSHPEEDRAEHAENSVQRGATFTIGNRKIPRILTKEEIADILRISRPVPRDNLIIQCMYFLGMTNAEMQNLMVEDIDFSNDKIKVSEGKNRRDRILPMPAELSQDLKAYVGARTSGYLIRGRDKKAKRISDRHIRRIVKAYAKEANVRNADEVHPHTLRHSYATHLLDEGTPIETVQSILGHERLETTAIYSHARNTRELQDQVNSAFSG